MAALMPAPWPRVDPASERLLAIDPRSQRFVDARVRHLPALLGAGDLVVVNDAATLPASLRALGGALELRLLGRLDDDAHWRAVLFGAGDFRTRTEDRPLPPVLQPGDVLDFGALQARVSTVDAEQPRLISVEFGQRGAEFWAGLYRSGRPVQYAHIERPLELWHVQSHFASRPWALEMASAGRPLSFALLVALRQRGVNVAALTHAAGLSSLGAPELDRRLPLLERYAIPEETAELVETTHTAGGRVLAVGTTVVRALESSALRDGRVHAGEGEASLVIGPGFVPRATDGLLTGLHEAGTSHFALLEGFAPRGLLERGLTHAASAGYLQHEFGDSCLILAA
jgi:S-adenosylmethionine:tRNA ribosyltransferase-isomerase